MIKIDHFIRGERQDLPHAVLQGVQKALPYLIAAVMALVVVQLRWYAVDSDSYFIVGTRARQTYYAVRDMSYGDREATEQLRTQVEDGIVGVVVKGHMRSNVGFNEECEILLNSPLEDTLLPEELRALLNSMELDKREQVIATVRSIRDDLLRDLKLTPDEKDEFIWQRIALLESEPSAANVIFQILQALTEGDNLMDPQMTERVKTLAASDIETVRHLLYAGDVIVDKGTLVTPQIAQLLKLQGYPEGQFPIGSLAFAIAAAWIGVLWIKKTMAHSFVLNGYRGNWVYPFFLLILGWFMQLALVYWGVNGLGLLPVIAITYLTLPDLGALNCSLAITLSGSIITSGYDVTSFAVSSISGCAAALLGLSLFKKNFSRSGVWGHALILGLSMFCMASLIHWGLTSQLKMQEVGTMLLSCLLLSFTVLIILPILENIFAIVSPLQLVELTHPSHPLQRRMQIEAPGTYHHSQMVGNLAEAAAEKIGLNPMLMRAGACFHDIGKLRRPQFFIENQISGINSHDSMSPAMSAMVILSHVKDGLELAEEFHLPTCIKAFIAEHHGTACLSYFYRKAIQSGLKADESQFCYPGPKPRSRETGLLMIADSVEAAVRAEGGKIKGYVDILRLVDSVVQSKINSGQLDEVPFTLKDISDIKSALVTTLRSMYHTREIRPLKLLPEGQGKETIDVNGTSPATSGQSGKTKETPAVTADPSLK